MENANKKWVTEEGSNKIYFTNEKGEKLVDVIEAEKQREKEEILADYRIRTSEAAKETPAENEDFPDYVEGHKKQAANEEKYLAEKEEQGWLSESQRKALNVLLVSLGVTVSAGAVKQGYDSFSESFEPTNNIETKSVIEKVSNDFDNEIELHLSELDKTRLLKAIDSADATVSGSEQTTVEYFVDEIKFRSELDKKTNRPALPDVLQEELKEKLPGWIAQESLFDPEAVSHSGAVGYVQAMPFVYNEYYNTKDVSTDIDRQIEFMGLHTSNNYHYINHYAGEETLNQLRSKFESEEEFLKDVMALLVINSYNSGGPIIGKALKKFVEDTPADDLKSGKELFLQFAEYAHKNFAEEGYVKERREYVPKIYAFQQAINESKYNNTHLASK